MDFRIIGRTEQRASRLHFQEWLPKQQSKIEPQRNLCSQHTEKAACHAQNLQARDSSYLCYVQHQQKDVSHLAPCLTRFWIWVPSKHVWFSETLSVRCSFSLQKEKHIKESWNKSELSQSTEDEFSCKSVITWICNCDLWSVTESDPVNHHWDTLFYRWYKLSL